MAEIFAHITHWDWWILAVALVVLEALLPGTFFLWMGLASASVGLVLLLFPGTGWEIQLLLFAAISVASILLWKRFAPVREAPADHPALNRRGEQYVGRAFTLAEPIVNGFGKIKVDDSTWKIEGPDAAVGTRVRVRGVDGVILKVEPEGS